MAEDDLIYFNGINAGSGGYSLPPLAPAKFSDLVQDVSFDPARLEALQNLHQKQAAKHFGLKEGLDPKQLGQAGWGIIFPTEVDPQIVEALQPLIDWRKEQVGQANERFHKVYQGGAGFRPEDDKDSWLGRSQAHSGPVDPLKVPYYLLLVGTPEQIPFSFQNQLDVQYGVGRVCFDTPAEYAAYAASVVAAEKRGLRLARRAAFFGTAHPDDPATLSSAADMVQPLYDLLCEDADAARGGWQFDLALKEQATRARLASWLGGPQTPALLYTAGHGLAFENGSAGQRDGQGALLTQEFPGPAHWPNKPIPREHYFAGEDLADAGSLLGLVAFFFACFGAGTPVFDEFAGKALRSFGQSPAAGDPAQLAPAPFIARLPQRMLSHPRGGALAVIGHVERTWGYSFLWGRAGPQLAVFESTLKRLLSGHPVGSAFEYFNMRYAELTSNLFNELLRIEAGKTPKPRELSSLWAATNDARNYVVLGDPAVRLLVADEAATGAPARERITLSPQVAPQPISETASPVSTQAQPDLKPLSPAGAVRVTTWLNRDLQPQSLIDGDPAALLQGGALLCAISYLQPGGEITTVVNGPPAPDAAILSLHAEMVKQAAALI